MSPNASLSDENEFNLEMCKKYGLKYILISNNYSIDVDKVICD